MNKRVFFLGKEFSYETFSSKEIELEKSESDGSKRTVTVTKIALNGKKRRKSMGHRTKRFFQWSGKMGERF